MFDEYFNPLTIAVSPVLVAATPRAVDLADSLVSTSIDQDAPSTSIPSTQDQEHSPIISQCFEESPKTPHFHDDPLHESLYEDLTSQGSSCNVRPIHTLLESLGRWTKDHPIENVIRDPSRSVSTRKQLWTDVLWCYFNAILTSVEPKNFKQAMTEPSWIDAMQEEIHEFERNVIGFQLHAQFRTRHHFSPLLQLRAIFIGDTTKRFQADDLKVKGEDIVEENQIILCLEGKELHVSGDASSFHGVRESESCKHKRNNGNNLIKNHVESKVANQGINASERH
ncbi:hypothetical protein Tco_0478755 [Tanacetum coccineum]